MCAIVTNAGGRARCMHDFVPTEEGDLALKVSERYPHPSARRLSVA